MISGQATLTVSFSDNSAVTTNADIEVFISETGQNFSCKLNDTIDIALREAKSYNLTVFSFQYNTSSKLIELEGDTSVTIIMTPLSQDLDAVMIASKREELFSLKSLGAIEGTAIYSGKKTERVMMDAMLANKASNNARQIFSKVSGINVYDASEGGIQLNIGGRGLDPNRSANFNIRQNAYDISADVLGYPESYYTPPAEAIDEIQVVRGAASLQYGTQFGGLINFKLKDASSLYDWQVVSRQSYGSYGFFNSFNSFSKASGKSSFYGYFNYRRGDGLRANSDFESVNLYGKYTYRFSDKTKLSLEHTYFDYLARQAGGLTDSQFQEDIFFSNRERNWFEVKWNLTALKFEHLIGKRSRFTADVFRLDAQRNALGYRGFVNDLNSNPVTDPDAIDLDGNYIFPRDLITGTFRNFGIETRYLLDYTLPFLKNADKLNTNSWLIGVKYYHANNNAGQGAGDFGTEADFNFLKDSTLFYPNESSFDFPNRNLSVFSESIIKISDRLSVVPGLRFEHINTAADGQYRNTVYDNAGNALSSLIIEENRDFVRNFLLWGLGLSYKPGGQSELILNYSRNYRSITFSDIRTVNPAFIIDPDITDESGYTVDLSFKTNIDKVLSVQAGTFLLAYEDRIGVVFDNRANRVRKNIGDARILGFESLIQCNFNKWFSPGNYDMAYSAYVNIALTHSEYVESQENNVVGKKLEFVPEVNLRTGINYSYKRFKCAFQWTYLSEQYTDGQNSEVTTPGDQREGLIGPIPAYSIFDISASYSKSFYALEFGMNNVGDTRYFTQRATGYPGPGIIPSYGRNFYVTLQLNFAQLSKRS